MVECGRFYCMATRNDHLVWYCPSTRKTNGLQICHAKSFTEEEITYIVKKAARKLLKNAVPRLEKVLNDDYVERDRSTYKGQLADIDKAIDADLEAAYGRIDTLVNNAGITKDGLLMGMSEEDFDLAHNKGHEFIIPLDAPAVRHLRVRGVECFGGTIGCFAELQIFGDPGK